MVIFPSFPSPPFPSLPFPWRPFTSVPFLYVFPYSSRIVFVMLLVDLSFICFCNWSIYRMHPLAEQLNVPQLFRLEPKVVSQDPKSDLTGVLGPRLHKAMSTAIHSSRRLNCMAFLEFLLQTHVDLYPFFFVRSYFYILIYILCFSLFVSLLILIFVYVFFLCLFLYLSLSLSRSLSLSLFVSWVGLI